MDNIQAEKAGTSSGKSKDGHRAVTHQGGQDGDQQEDEKDWEKVDSSEAQGVVEAWVYVWSDDLEGLEPGIWRCVILSLR